MNEIPLTQGFNSILGPAVLEIDQAIVTVQKSQDDLGKEIERLVAELELFTDIAEPPTLVPCLEKLLDAKKRLSSANKLMAQTNDRVERIQKEIIDTNKE
ncbi:uncharacterized protein EV154DRAFT_528870 [Mucor mucedo]|uniref:uncharacterized protein n=1 Tax=Mucor mucedo TaxID=29922 RepID=UPI0022207652|nr:uncharacterized protein EV154DRAFT_528870 [Mucor mucedo]KAI7873111.1 hypothetical protein EV154DRAFT_528870 [Mucor mucedo]